MTQMLIKRGPISPVGVTAETSVLIVRKLFDDWMHTLENKSKIFRDKVIQLRQTDGMTAQLRTESSPRFVEIVRI